MKEILSSSAKVFFCICTYLAALNASDHQSSRHQDYYKMFLDGELTDFAIVSEEDTTFPCHKMVLFAANKYWRALFSNRNCKEYREGRVYLPYSHCAIKIILEKTYVPDQELIIGTIELSDYLDLFDFANLSLDRSLIDILATADIKFKNNILYALEATIINKDGHLGDQAFKYVRDMTIDEEICNYLIEMLECNNEIIIYFMHRIRTSTLVKYLAENNKNLLIAHNILKDNKYILDMKNWSAEEIENELDEYNYKNTLNELIQNLQANLLNRAEILQIRGAEQALSFLATYFSINISAAIMSVGDFYTPCFSKMVHKSLLQIARDDISKYNPASFLRYINRDYLIFQRACKAIKDATNKATAVALSKTTKIDKVINLAQLFVLAYISEPEFQNEYFQSSYKDILSNLQPNPIISYREILYKIFTLCSANSNLEENPFIKSFKEIMTGVVAKLDNI